MTSNADDFNVRKVTDEEFAEWSDVHDIAYHAPERRGSGPARMSTWDRERCWGAFEAGRPVAALRGSVMELTVPGGIAVPVDVIHTLNVLPTHIRRGLMRRLMAAELDAAAGRGGPLVAVNVAEHAVFGRFGFGPAAAAATWRLDLRTARFTRELPGRIRFASAAEARAAAPLVYDLVRAVTPGAVSRSARWWDAALGTGEGATPPKEQLCALCYDDADAPVGFIRYSIDESWTENRATSQVDIRDLFATSVEYEARLWQFTGRHDWVSTALAVDSRRADELWPDLLADRRVARPNDHWQPLWLRVLDPAAALALRRYEVPGSLVLGVTDPDGRADGVYELDGGPDGAQCVRSDREPQVVLPVDVLGSIYLGGFSAARYAATGRVEEREPGALARLSAMFLTAIAPWPLTVF